MKKTKEKKRADERKQHIKKIRASNIVSLMRLKCVCVAHINDDNNTHNVYGHLKRLCCFESKTLVLECKRHALFIIMFHSHCKYFVNIWIIVFAINCINRNKISIMIQMISHRLMIVFLFEIVYRWHSWRIQVNI